MTRFFGWLLAWVHYLFPNVAWEACEIEAGWLGEDWEDCIYEPLESADEEEDDDESGAEGPFPCERDDDPDCHLCAETDCEFHPRFGGGEGGEA